MNGSTLAAAIAWPLTTLIILGACRERVLKLLDALCLKLGQAERISIGKDGLTLISTIARQNVIAGSASASTPDRASADVSQETADPHQAEQAEFQDLMAQYRNCAVPDLAERVRVRRRLADRLGQLALSLTMDRTALADSDEEGRLVAFGTLVILEPQPGDLKLLETAARRAAYNFTRYRLVLAVPPALTVDDHRDAPGRALSVLAAAEERPNTDSHLRRLIHDTRQAIAPH